MIVDGEVHEAFVAGLQDAVEDELGAQHPVATLARHVIEPVDSQMQFTGKEPDIALGLG